MIRTCCSPGIAAKLHEFNFLIFSIIKVPVLNKSLDELNYRLDLIFFQELAPCGHGRPGKTIFNCLEKILILRQLSRVCRTNLERPLDKVPGPGEQTIRRWTISTTLNAVTPDTTLEIYLLSLLQKVLLHWIWNTGRCRPNQQKRNHQGQKKY